MSDQLSGHNFQRFATVIQDHSGIRMPPSKRTMLEGRLRKRVRMLELQDVNAYATYVFELGHLPEEFVHLIDMATTNKTDFFREPEHFDYLRDEAVPRLLEARRYGTERLLKVWSAAASTGAEAYTLAMVLADMGLHGSGVRFAILGTDISTEVLDQARLGIYPAEMVVPVPPDMQRRYLMRSREHPEVRIVPELRRLVRFEHLNLMDHGYPFDRDVDVIFLRNVLIYFDRPTQQAVLERLCGHLRPGGYLFLGHSESMAGSDLGMVQSAPTVFRRR